MPPISSSLWALLSRTTQGAAHHVLHTPRLPLNVRVFALDTPQQTQQRCNFCFKKASLRDASKLPRGEMVTSAAAASFTTGAAAGGRPRPASKTHRRSAARRAAMPPRARPIAAAVVSGPAPGAGPEKGPAPAARTTDAVLRDALADGVEVIRCVCTERLKFEVRPGCGVWGWKCWVWGARCGVQGKELGV